MTDTDTDHSPRITWQPRVVLDFAVRRLYAGLREKPTQKPILLFLPKGAPSALLAAFLAATAAVDRNTVCLIEDEQVAVEFHDIEMPEHVRKSTRFVIGDLKSLAKTDKGCYGGVVVIAYDCEMPPARGENLPMYLDDKTNLLTQLCGWNAHVVYLDQPLRDFPDDVLAEMAESEKVRRRICLLTATRDSSFFGSRLRSLGRRVTMVGADWAGSDRNAAVCLYVQIFRASGKGSRRLVGQDVRAAIFETEMSAVQHYKNEEACPSGTFSDESPCLFMLKPFYDTWVRQVLATQNPTPFHRGIP